MSARDGLGPLPDNAVIGARYDTPAKAAARALKMGPRFGRVGLAASGSDDRAREAAVVAACAGKYPVYKLPGTWYDGATAYTVSAVDCIYTPPAIAWTAALSSTGVCALPAWLTYRCASGIRTTQLSATAIQSSVAIDAAPWRSVDGVAGGLRCDPARTNKPMNSDDWGGSTGWSAGTMTTVGTVAGPDGVATSAHNFTGNASGQQTPTNNVTVAAGDTISLWVKVNSITGAATLQLWQGSTVRIAAITATGWTRYEVYCAAGDSNLFFIQVGTGTVDFDVYGLQVETGKTATDHFPKVGTGTVTRPAATLRAIGSVFTPDGFFDWTFVVRPGYANGENAADHYYWYIDANNKLRMQATWNSIAMTVGGHTVTGNTLTWSRDQALTIRCWSLPSGKGITVSGATTGNGTTTDTAESAMTVPATVSIMGAGGAEEPASLCSMTRNYP